MQQQCFLGSISDKTVFVFPFSPSKQLDESALVAGHIHVLFNIRIQQLVNIF